ncbi:sensor histidine kinase [Chitinimonas sp.]|uniref:sensor histidine kinase n=1 Tax=Chitinimonas sp. TaxID=1934313 RepID=UPI0035B48018
MSRLYVRFYLALLASLLVFALITVVIWHRTDGPMERAFALQAQLAANVLAPPDASPAAQQAALERLSHGIAADFTVLDAQRRQLAAVGEPLALPHDKINHLSWPHPRRPGAVWLVHLRDGRYLLSSMPLGMVRLSHNMVLTLLLLALVIGIGAYPVMRRLSQRLERLKQAVETFGAGNMAARVSVQGRDEVAVLAASFNRAAERIEALLAAHKTLLANASHELRTPLARIRMAIELAQDGIDPKRRSGLAQDIAELDTLIDEILLASRLDALAEDMARDPVDLLALFAEECARFEQVQFDGIALSVPGDARLLRRLLRNLLENAHKYGRPPIRVMLGADAGFARLQVVDAGAAIPVAERESIFAPFFRRSGTVENLGAGLGLSLVRQIARRHGGEACYGDLGEGLAGFLVTLKRA